MSQAVAGKCRRFRTIAINNTFQLAPWADMLYAADVKWWTFTDWKSFAGLKVTCDVTVFKDLLHLRHTGDKGFDPDPGCVRTGRNSGYQAIHIAAHAGCKRILLCGFDMRGGHWHGPHKRPLRDDGNVYARWIPHFATLKPELDRRGIEVINCTPGSALKCFSMMALDEACALPDSAGARLSA
jgi:hypothetical protein